MIMEGNGWNEFLSYLNAAKDGAETFSAVGNAAGQIVGNAVAGYNAGKADGASGANVNVKVKDEGGSFAKVAIILGVAAVAVVLIIKFAKK